MHRIVVNELLSVYFIKLLQIFVNISPLLSDMIVLRGCHGRDHMTTDNEDDSMIVT
jgi:hypothetical protein